MVTPVPKKALIRAILDEYPPEDIRGHFHIGLETDLVSRLDDFKKSALLEFLLLSENGETRLNELKKKYPLGTSPTLYLVYINHRPEFDVLIEDTQQLAKSGRTKGREFGEGQAVRIVYLDQPSYLVPFNKETIEIPLCYERRFEYNVGDPTSEDYGEHIAEYSLEKSYLWMVRGFSHGALCCSDYVAVNPIRKYLSLLNIKCYLPNLTEEMLFRLAADASPKSATFSKPEIEQRVGFDVQTVIVSDPLLKERNAYQQIKEDKNRYQTSGFYKNHPDLAFGGLGISRQYGRVWTPAHLSHNNLIALSIGLVNNTERELTEQFQRGSAGYLSYFRNIPVEVGTYTLRGRERDTFDSLLTYILDAQKANGEITLSPSRVHRLVQHQKHLMLMVLSSFDCPNCRQDVLGVCLECNLPFQAKIVDDQIVLECPGCRARLNQEDDFLCECAEKLPILAIGNHLSILPKPELLAGIQSFLMNLDDVKWDGTFYIDGQVLRLLELPEHPIETSVRLDDLRSWRSAARIHTRTTPADRKRTQLIRILNKSREKCAINDYHPKKEDCVQCLKREITAKEIKTGTTCLPRIMGLAISQRFDGCHHRYEIADVKYRDTLDLSDRHVNIGIHLKSRERTQKRVGRRNTKIKGLYAQAFFSVYQTLVGKADFDIIGISIPNEYVNDVMESIQALINQLGLPLLIIDENDWLKIVETSLEQVQFNDD